METRLLQRIGSPVEEQKSAKAIQLPDWSPASGTDLAVCREDIDFSR
jgi:hypothetical protein